MIRAVIHSRVSTSGQETDGTSLETQGARCRAYAAEHEYRGIGIYTDVHTGTAKRGKGCVSLTIWCFAFEEGSVTIVRR
jgi:DNA invertase Pin-like site-specific DNA recombinase